MSNVVVFQDGSKIVRLKDIKAADPGLGFTLDISDENGNPTQETAKVTVSISENSISPTSSSSSVYINNPMNSVEHNFVVPFSDSNYQSLSQLFYTIAVECPIGTLTFTSPKTPVAKEKGHFMAMAMLNEIPPCSSPITEPSKVLWVGQMISSFGNASHFGILTKNGSFAVLPTSFVTLGSPLSNIQTTPASTNPSNTNPIGLYVDLNGRIFISHIGTSSVTPIAQSNDAIPGASMVISDGSICLKNGSLIIPATFSVQVANAENIDASEESFYEPAEKLEESLQP